MFQTYNFLLIFYSEINVNFWVNYVQYIKLIDRIVYLFATLKFWSYVWIIPNILYRI